MINHEDYDCKEQGECYLTYRKRMKREHEQHLLDRRVDQTDDEWRKEYATYTKIYATGLRRLEGETADELKARFESRQAPDVGEDERRQA